MSPKDCRTTASTVINIIGVFLIHLPSRPLLYLGNIAVYVPSYTTHFHSHGTISTTTATASFRLHATTRPPNTITNATGRLPELVVPTRIAVPRIMTTSINTSRSSEAVPDPSPPRVSHHGIQQSWYTPLFSCSWMFGAFLSGLITKSDHVTACTARIVIGLGVLVQSGAFFIAFFTINIPHISESTFLVTLLSGLGFGPGLFEGVLLKFYVADRVSSNSLEVVTSFVLSSSAVGGVVINEMITLLTNPDNLSPDVKLGHLLIFSQKEIQQRIPFVFLIVGAVIFVMTSLGFVMLREKPRDFDKASDEGEKLESSLRIHSGSFLAAEGGQSNKTERAGVSGDGVSTGVYRSLENQTHTQISKEHMTVGTYKSLEHTVVQKTQNLLEIKTPHDLGLAMKRNILNLNQIIPSSEKRQMSSSLTDDDPNHASPLNMLRCPSGYKLAAVYVCGSSARLLLNLYYKIYGQVWIHDDYFLTSIGTAMSILAIFSTVVWGLVLERIGITHCFVLLYSGIPLTFLLMYFMARVDRWAYLVATLTNSGFVNYLYPIFTITTIKWFGKKDLSTKLGIAETFSLVGYVLASFVMDALMDGFGFFYGFAWTSAVHCVGLVVIAWTFPSS